MADAWKRFSQVFNLKDQKPITFVPKPQRNGRAVTDGCFVAWPKDSLILLGWEEGVVQVPGEKEKKKKLPSRHEVEHRAVGSIRPKFYQ